MENLFPEATEDGPLGLPGDSDGGGELVTLSVKEMPLTDFLRVLGSRYGVSVIWSDSMDRRVVSVEAMRVPVSEVFDGLARRFGVVSQRIGASWYVGEFRDEDRATLVRKTVRLSAEDLQGALGVILGPDARSRALKDGLIVVSDRAETLRRLSMSLDQIEAARADSWVVQLYLFSCSSDASRSLGFDTSSLIDLSYTFAKSSLSPSPANGVHLASSFRAVMAATATRQDVKLVGRPLFVLGDGEKASFVSGASVPVPKKTVSDQGTVTTSGFDYVQSGLSASVGLRDYGRGLAYLTLQASLGQITGYVETAPIQAKNDFDTAAVLASGGVYLLGALDQDSATGSVSGLSASLTTKKTADVVSSQIQIWARIYRIAGGVRKSVDLGTGFKPAILAPMETVAGSRPGAPARAEVIDLESGRVGGVK